MGHLAMLLFAAALGPRAAALHQQTSAGQQPAAEPPSAEAAKTGAGGFPHSAGYHPVQWFVVACIPFLLWANGSPQVAHSFIIGGWMLSSLSMNVANKQATAAFHAPALLVIAQMILAAIVVLFMQGQELKFKHWRDLARWCVIPVFFAGMLTTSVLAFGETTMSSVLILRNLLPLVAFAAEKTLMNTPARVSKSMVLSIVLTLLGTILYGYTSASVTRRGAMLIGLNCAITVVDRVLQRFFLSDPAFSVSLPLCMVVNNTLGILPMLAFGQLTGEMDSWGDVVQDSTSLAWFWVTISGLVGCCLGYQGLKCQKLVTATTFLMLQNFIKVAVISLDIVVMRNHISGISFLGCTLSFAGAFWYGAEQVRERNLEETPLGTPLGAKKRAEPVAIAQRP